MDKDFLNYILNFVPSYPINEKNNKFVVDGLIGSTLIAYKNYITSDINTFIYTANNFDVNNIYNFLSNLVDQKDIILIPSEEMIRVEYISSSKEILAQQIDGLNRLIDCKHKIIILAPSTIYRFFPTKETFLQNTFKIKKGDEIDLIEFKKKLAEAGYIKVNKIDSSLQFASRGDIVDVFSLNYVNPIRIEFFGDEIDSIRLFDIATQTSYEEMDEVEILPASVYLFSKEEKSQIKEKILNQFELDKRNLSALQIEHLSATIEDDLEELLSNNISIKNYKYIGFLQGFYSKLTDFCSDFCIVNANEEEFLKSKEIIFNDARKFLLDLQEAGTSISHLAYFDERRAIYVGSKSTFILNNFYIHNDAVTIPIKRPALSLVNDKNMMLILKGYLSLNYKMILGYADKTQKESIEIALKQLDIDYDYSIPKDIKSLKQATIISNNSSNGLEISRENIVFLTPKELFGYKKKTFAYASKFKEGTILGSYLELEKGDFVVHEQYGIGKFLGVVTLEVNKNHEDFLQIEYNNGDKLYVPLYQFNMIRKYVGKDGVSPRLSTLGSSKWENTKKAIKEKINDLALRLLTLYQERQQDEGFAFEKDDEIQKSFEDEFEYKLTKDQETSLKEIKEDMESPHPMDRLLCGDVGFGKTEIAFRAAMKAILNGKQVCFLCPTTILAKQHYDLALERFKNYGVHICSLSRLNKDSINKQNIEAINNGKIDLAIGTHKLLSKKVNFKNLGLLIVDEEQRFGVVDKENIKEKARNVDCLSLSATPIPRTLQTTLIGLKSVSTIETSPEGRNPVQTYVIKYDDTIVRELIKRELSRNGQVYYVCNSIQNLYLQKNRLDILIPEIKSSVVHADLSKDEIEEEMSKFYSGETNVLFATTIIENGIDIKNANLIIIEDADILGLTQLYQLKGRVGRGDRIAFAYLMINTKRKITPVAKKRLKAIQDFTELGSGYKIAQRDLLIRGAGDILGSQQAGFVDEVGVDMYIKLLNEAIIEQKTGKKVEKTQENISNLKIDAYIPQEFANDEDKVLLYQKILECKDIKELNNFRYTIQDMYGKIPLSFETLMKKRKVDIYLNNKNCFVSCKDENEKVTLIMSNQFTLIDGVGNKLFQSLARYMNQMRVDYRNKVLSIILNKNDNWLNLLIKVMEIIIKLFNDNERAKLLEEA